MKLTVKCYNSNARVWNEDGDSITINYDGDVCNGFTAAEFMATVKEEILEAFPEADAESLEKVLERIETYAQGFCEE